MQLLKGGLQARGVEQTPRGIAAPQSANPVAAAAAAFSIGAAPTDGPSAALLTLWYAAPMVGLLVIAVSCVLFWRSSLRRAVAVRTAELRRTAEFHRALFESSPVAQFSVDLCGNVLTWNPAAERMFGWSADEVVGRRLPLLLEEVSERAARACQDLAAGKPFKDEEIWRNRKDGSTVVGLYSGSPVYDASGALVGVAGAVLDVTERRQAESALRESERRLNVLMGNLPGMAYRCLFEPGWPMEFVSQGCLALTGYSADELTDGDGIQYGDLIHPDDRQHVLDVVTEAVREGRSFTLEYRIRTKDGGERYVWEQGRWVSRGDDGAHRLEGFVADTTDRKRAEAERERLVAAVEQAGEVIIITDPDGVIEYVNAAFERTTGYTCAEAIGKTPKMLSSGVHDDAFYRDLWDTIRSGRVWSGRITNRRKDGSLYTEEVTISPVMDAQGGVVNYVAAKGDISRRIELEEQHQQTQKLEAVGRLAGGVAHDFNNMLNVILNRVEMMIEEADPVSPNREAMQEIHDAATRSAELTRQLLGFARRQEASPRPVDLNETVSGMTRMLERLISEDIALVWSPGAGVPNVRIDPSQLDQVLVNLCVNARDAIEGTGRITIETAAVPGDEIEPAVSAGCASERFAALIVSDSGCGMDAETKEHIFDPFYTTKGLGQGTGLGLATVYGIVKQNGGFIGVDSDKGKGSTFRIYLPECTDPVEPLADPAPASPRASRSGGELILFVEDEPAILRSGVAVLEKLGYRVLPAQTPDDALRLAEEHEGAIDLLVTDVVMPGMDGRELAERLRSWRPNLPCLFTSGYTADIISKKGALDPGVHFLQKPFSIYDIADRVRALLDARPAAREDSPDLESEAVKD